VLWEIGRIVHEADLADERFDAPEAPGLDVLLRGLSMTHDDDALLALTAPLFDALYEFKRRSLLLGREPVISSGRVVYGDEIDGVAAAAAGRSGLRERAGAVVGSAALLLGFGARRSGSARRLAGVAPTCGGPVLVIDVYPY
jgi:hypothetical protein